ncbi:MAG: IS110 family transposase [Bryobacteraceae bacterium]
MKKNSTASNGDSKLTKTVLRDLRQRAEKGRLSIGLDLGDRMTHYCVLDEKGELCIQGKLATTKTGLNPLLEQLPETRVVLEVGTHSPWASRHVSGMGHEVIVANPRRVSMISGSKRKNDRLDAEKLARLGRVDPKLLAPIHHRDEDVQRDLMEIRMRHVLVESRTKLVNSARGQMKSMGYRLRSCDCDQVGVELAAELPEEVRKPVEVLLETVAHLTKQIKLAEERIHAVAQRYPEIELLTVIYGVGELTALAYVLTVEDKTRFSKSREVGPYLGMVPGQAQSGEKDSQQRITKEGDRMVRWLLVQCAHCILKEGAPDSDLRRWGLAKLEEHQQQAQKSGKKGTKGTKGKGKKRVLVAVARRLAVVMHVLWANGEEYDPLYGAKQQEAQAAKAAAKKAAKNRAA